MKELTLLGYQREFVTRLRGLQIEGNENYEEFIMNVFWNSDVSLQDNHENNGNTYLRNDLNKCELKNLSTMNEELEKQISKVKSLDTAIKKFDNNVEVNIFCKFEYIYIKWRSCLIYSL